MPSIVKLRLKFRDRIFIPLTCKNRGKKLAHTDFTIIFNNCWGGMVYEIHNLPKESPTVGMFFMADDYIRFLSHLKEYIAADLTFIKPEESQWNNEKVTCGDKRWGIYPVGKIQIGGGIEPIEIFSPLPQ